MMELSDAELIELVGLGLTVPRCQRLRADRVIDEFVRRELVSAANLEAEGNGVLHGGHMLVLSRQRDETVMIGDDIEVTIVDIRGDKVRLGINAPKDIAVHRKEVWDAIRRKGKAKADACCGHCGKAFAIDETRVMVNGEPLHAECAKKVAGTK